MTSYLDMTKEQLWSELASLQREYAKYKAKGLKLNMARGKPGVDQLELSLPMLNVITSASDLIAADGTDCRNYGNLEGIPEARELMAVMLDDEPENVLVGGNSSLTFMYDAFARYWKFGTPGFDPWNRIEGGAKWICPVPGYDRHFAICQEFGMEMIPVKMTPEGPDMDEVERIAASSDVVKGIWCVPKYSNPDGTTYSDETVRRLANMETAAGDFRIFWDNAYVVHHLYDEEENQDQLLDIAAECIKAGHSNRYLKFASTSKVTLPGAGVAALAASPSNVKQILRHMTIQSIGHDKINMLRHARFLDNGRGIDAHMSKQAALLRPKFELVDRKLQEGIAEAGIATWSKPRGGYFVSFNAFPGTAKQVVAMCKEAGVVLTGAGATWPYGIDPEDSNIRIAPTLPPLEELDAAMDVLICCAKHVAVEKLLNAETINPEK